MRRPGRLRLLGIAALLVLGVTVLGCDRAGSSSAPPTPDPFAGLAQRSDEAFRQGLEAYGQGQYRDALISFESARTLSPSADPRIEQMIQRTRAAMAPTPTPPPATPTPVVAPASPTPLAMSSLAPDTALGRRYFGLVTLAMVPARDSDAPPASEFFFQDQVGLHIQGLKQHLRLPFTLRVFDTDTGRLVASVASEDAPTPVPTPAAMRPSQSPPTASSTPGSTGVSGSAVQDAHLARFWDTYVWYHQGGEQPGSYRAELYANGVLTDTFAYTVGTLPVPVPEPLVSLDAANARAAPAALAGQPGAAGEANGGPDAAAPELASTASAPGAPGQSGGRGPAPAAAAGSAAPGRGSAGTAAQTGSGAAPAPATRSGPAAPAMPTGRAAHDPPGNQTEPAASPNQTGRDAPALVELPEPTPTVAPPAAVPTPATAAVTQLGGQPAGLDVNPDDGRVFIADGSGGLWTSDAGQPTSFHQPLALDHLPVDLAVDRGSGNLFVASSNPPAVLVLDAGGRRLSTIDLPAAPGDLQVDADLGLAYVALPDRQALGVIDMRGGRLLRTIEGLSQITSLALDPVRHVLYASQLGGELTVVDVASSQVLARLALTGVGLQRVATARGLAYAVNTATHELVVVEPTSMSASHYALPVAPAALAASEDSGAVYVLASTPNAILRIDPTDGSDLGQIALPDASARLHLATPSNAVADAPALRPRMVLDPNDQRLFVTLPASGTLAVIADDQFPPADHVVAWLQPPTDLTSAADPEAR